MAIKSEKIQAYLELGISAHQTGNLKDAEKNYRRVLKINHMNPDALNLLGVISFQNGAPIKAKTLIKKAIQYYSKNAGYYNNLGQALQDLGEIEEAILTYKLALELSPNDPDILNNLGLSFSSIDRFEDAQSIYEDALSITKTDPQIFHNFGVMLQESGQLHAAIGSYKKALELNPDFPEVHASLASALEESGDRGLAIISYFKAIKIAPLYIEAHIGLKKIRWASNDIENLDESFHYACKVCPNSIEAHHNLANALLETGKIEAASLAINKALSISKSNAETFNLLAKIHKVQKNYNEAIIAQKQSIKLDCQNPFYRENLGETLCISKQFEEAIKELLIAHKINPRRSGVLGSLIIAMNETHDPRIKNFVDYGKWVTTRTINIPGGFSSLRDFNEALHSEIADRHDKSPPPMDQTMHGGTQIPNNLFKSPSGLTALIKNQITTELTQYIKSLDQDSTHPFLCYKNINFKYTGAWSTILYDEGYDSNHIHNEGWLSGVYYIKVPDLPDKIWENGQGCIQFGEPPSLFLSQQNKICRLIRPEEGCVVFFPSYYWHGVRPFKEKGLRHAIAFDII